MQQTENARWLGRARVNQQVAVAWEGPEPVPRPGKTQTMGADHWFTPDHSRRIKDGIVQTFCGIRVVFEGRASVIS